MTRKLFTANTDQYRDHFHIQVGGNLPGFRGSRMQHGDGLGSFFSNLARKAMPLIMSGLKLAAPHAKQAAKGIAQDVVSRAVHRFSGEESVSKPVKRSPMVYKRKRKPVVGSVKRSRQQPTPDFFGSD